MKALKIILIAGFFISLLAVIGVFVFRISKDIQKKRALPNTYAIQSIKSRKNIRVYNAGIEDGTKIILYSHHEWECMTWQFIRLEENIFLLKNLYTEKAFQPSTSPQPGVTLKQQPIGGSRLQYWEFIKQDNEAYLIKLNGTGLYLTVSSDKDDSDIILMPLHNSEEQKWRLVEQHPIQ